MIMHLFMLMLVHIEFRILSLHSCLVCALDIKYIYVYVIDNFTH